MVFDVAFIVFPQALPRGRVEDEGGRLQHDGDADVQVSVGHVVVQDTGALLPAERAPEQAGGVDAGPEDEGRGDEACERGRTRQAPAVRAGLPAVRMQAPCYPLQEPPAPQGAPGNGAGKTSLNPSSAFTCARS